MVKRTTITIETESLLVVRATAASRAWCSRCGAEEEMIAVQNLGVVSNLGRPELEEWLNSGDLHRAQLKDGSTVICLHSLLARVQNDKPAER
jgi:hypothetical protein